MGARSGPGQQAAGTTEWGLAGYEAELDRCAAALNHPEQIAEIRKSLPPEWVVRSGDDRVVVSTKWLSDRLRKFERNADKSEVREIEAHLTAMRHAAEEMQERAQEPAHSEASERLKQILDRREFVGARGPSALELWGTRAVRWLAAKVLALMTRLHLGAKAGNVLAWGIVGIAFAVLCVWVLRSLARTSRLAPAESSGRTEKAESRAWAQEALEAAERGDYREAVHCAYWASIVHLEALGLLKRDRARTPRESLRLLEPHPNEQKLLREFTRHFELIWYGYRPASADDWSNARTQLEKMGCLGHSTAAITNS